MLAPNTPLGAAAAAVAVALATPTQPAQPAQPAKQVVVQAEPAKRSSAHGLWAVLIARICKVLPLLCPLCGGQMRVIAFVTERTQMRRCTLSPIGI